MEHLAYKRKVTIMIAIMAAMLFAAVNQTIVGTALPRIIAELGGIQYFSWVFTIFMLASSITAILVGKLSDIYGRKPFILVGIGIFSVGSLLAGFSNDIFQLIACRGVQGLGGGLIMSTAFAAVGDLFAPRERGRWQGLMSSVFGLASVFGPTLGGWIVDNANWHWVFWVFLPFGIVAFVLILILFPNVEKKAGEKVDYAGSLFLTTTITPLLLAFSWAGSKYDWASVQIIGLFVATIASLIVFIVVENKVKSPVLPLHLFRNPIFSLSNIIGFILGAGMFGAAMYIPFFIQGVIGRSATASGFIMMPMTFGMVIASTLGGQFISKTGKYKILALAGLLVMSAGMFSLAFMDLNTTITHVIVSNIFIGVGLGMSFPVFTLTIQNAVEQRFLGVATASAQLFRQIGGTVGVALMGTIMNLRMEHETKEVTSEMGASMMNNPMLAKIVQKLDPQILMNHDGLEKLKDSIPSQLAPAFVKIMDSMRDVLSYGLTGVYFIAAFVVLAGFLLTFFLKEIPLRSSQPADEKQKKEKQQAM
ncbi:MDR family MFS transporter [Priestia koreensis]|uniref:MDR family MFS transporter n=1 Tax=Priestia koreensis TaxID=284581 RepID=UPI002040A07C|nr:MDR family MFS transporter [Priestia koreensis]MCM3003010.1 MFS transporter [Priestia koreensis]